MLRKTIQLFSQYMIHRKYQKQFQKIHSVPENAARARSGTVPPSDRNGHDLSLILFQIDRETSRSGRIAYFLHLLTQRVRCYDEIGWYDAARLVVILPYTSAPGAERLAKDL